MLRFKPPITSRKRCAYFLALRQLEPLFLLVLLPVAVRAAAQSLPGDEQPKTIRGTVVNSVTHAPIPRALVSSADGHFAVLTDSEGHFEFAAPKENRDGLSIGGGFVSSSFSLTPMHSYHGVLGGLVSLSARKPGFLDDPYDARPLDVSPDADITIPLIPEALIKGRVSLSTADVASGITIQLYTDQVMEGLPRWISGHSVRANSAGEFRFAELPAGSYKVVTHE